MDVCPCKSVGSGDALPQLRRLLIGDVADRYNRATTIVDLAKLLCLLFGATELRPAHPIVEALWLKLVAESGEEPAQRVSDATLQDSTLRGIFGDIPADVFPGGAFGLSSTAVVEKACTMLGHDTVRFGPELESVLAATTLCTSSKSPNAYLSGLSLSVLVEVWSSQSSTMAAAATVDHDMLRTSWDGFVDIGVCDTRWARPTGVPPSIVSVLHTVPTGEVGGARFWDAFPSPGPQLTAIGRIASRWHLAGRNAIDLAAVEAVRQGGVGTTYLASIEALLQSTIQVGAIDPKLCPLHETVPTNLNALRIASFFRRLFAANFLGGEQHFRTDTLEQFTQPGWITNRFNVADARTAVSSSELWNAVVNPAEAQDRGKEGAARVGTNVAAYIQGKLQQEPPRNHGAAINSEALVGLLIRVRMVDLVLHRDLHATELRPPLFPRALKLPLEMEKSPAPPGYGAERVAGFAEVHANARSAAAAAALSKAAAREHCIDRCTVASLCPQLQLIKDVAFRQVAQSCVLRTALTHMKTATVKPSSSAEAPRTTPMRARVSLCSTAAAVGRAEEIVAVGNLTLMRDLTQPQSTSVAPPSPSPTIRPGLVTEPGTGIAPLLGELRNEMDEWAKFVRSSFFGTAFAIAKEYTLTSTVTQSMLEQHVVEHAVSIEDSSQEVCDDASSRLSPAKSARERRALQRRLRTLVRDLASVEEQVDTRRKSLTSVTNARDTVQAVAQQLRLEAQHAVAIAETDLAGIQLEHQSTLAAVAAREDHYLQEWMAVEMASITAFESELEAKGNPTQAVHRLHRELREAEAALLKEKRRLEMLQVEQRFSLVGKW
jgi:hypothetical protein